MRLLRIDNKLVRLGNGLATVETGSCCCEDDALAVKFVECCDDTRAIWVRKEVVPADCNGFLAGGVCFRNTREERLVSELLAEGQSVFAYLPGECGVTCGQEPCPPCPPGCCIRAFVQPCQAPMPAPGDRQCCPFGNYYEVQYAYEFELISTGYACQQGGCVGRQDRPGCIGFNPGLLEQYNETVTASVRYSGLSPLGIPCSEESCSNTRTTNRTLWTIDGWDYPPGQVPIPRNPRYETTNSNTTTQTCLFERGELPGPIYFPCNFTRVLLYDGLGSQCLERYESASGSLGCNEGSQQYTRQASTFSCCDTEGRTLETLTVITASMSYTVTPLDPQGCRIDPCGAPPPSFPAPPMELRPSGLVVPHRAIAVQSRAAGGCSGCRQERGL